MYPLAPTVQKWGQIIHDMSAAILCWWCHLKPESVQYGATRKGLQNFYRYTSLTQSSVGFSCPSWEWLVTHLRSFKDKTRPSLQSCCFMAHVWRTTNQSWAGLNFCQQLNNAVTCQPMPYFCFATSTYVCVSNVAPVLAFNQLINLDV